MKERLYSSLIELTNGPVTSTALRKFAQSGVSRPFIKLYAKAYRINQEEMLEDINEYPCLHDFFIRKLKEEARPLNFETDTIVSPVDGVIEKCGIVTEDCVMTVKEKNYSIEEMLGRKDMAERFAGGTYVLLYLSPSHYHRIHSPVDGTVLESYSLGKKSFPVNRLGLKYGKGVLAKNFRTVTLLQHGRTKIAMVKVGAMFINSVVVTNKNSEWKKGEEAAYFSFGSTVLLFFEKDAFSLNPELKTPSEIRMGERLGIIDKTKSAI